MSDINRTARVTAYRTRAGTPGGFIASNPRFFETLPNGVEIRDLRIEAQVEKHVDKEPNTCKIKIYNCNEQTRSFLKQKPLIVRLDAGYNGNLNYVFIGDLRNGYSEFTDASVITTLELADGDRAYRYAQVTKSYRKGTPVIQAVKDAAASMGLHLDPALLNAPDLRVQFAAGRSLTGQTRDELTRLLAEFGYRWSIQDGKLAVFKDNQFKSDQAVLISQETGMIGSPTFVTPEKPGKPILLKVKTKPRFEVTPHGRISVQSREVTGGAFIVQKIEHTLDTRSGPWESSIEAQST